MERKGIMRLGKGAASYHICRDCGAVLFRSRALSLDAYEGPAHTHGCHYAVLEAPSGNRVVRPRKDVSLGGAFAKVVSWHETEAEAVHAAWHS